ncbi:MAG: HAMP domain-containing sensor histidine kinase [Planctomycetota bacterium]
MLARAQSVDSRGRRFRAARLALRSVAFVVAPLAAALAVLAPDRSDETVRADAEAAATLVARAVEARWTAALEGDAPFGVRARAVIDEGPSSDVRTGSGSDAAAGTASRATLAQMEAAPDPVAALRAAVDRKGPLAGDAAVALARRARAGVPGAVEALADALPTLAPSAAVDGVPARALAALIAHVALGADAAARALADVGDAVRSGDLLPGDSATVRGGRALFDEDATWRAVAALARERLGADVDVDRALAREHRRDSAIGRALLAGGAAGSASGWIPLEAANGAWLLARTLGSGPGGGPDRAEVARLDLDDVLRELARALPEREGWSLRWSSGAHAQADAAPEPQTLPELAATEPLAGTGLRAALGTARLAERLRAARVRTLLLRGAGLAVALLLLVASLAVLRTLSNTERLLQLRSTFVASVSHDLRTPVASVALMAENLRSGHAAGREAEYAAAIEREAARLGRLVDDLLDFGRIERGLPAKLVRERVRLRAWLEAFGAAEVAKCAARDRTLRVSLGPLPEAADVDRHAIERALSNLIDNALVHAGGSPIELRASCERGALAFEVLDEGGAVQASQLDALFEPFAQGSDRPAVSGGTGLGLAIVRAVAEAHGGTARLEARTDGTAGLRALVEVPLGTTATDPEDRAA